MVVRRGAHTTMKTLLGGVLGDLGGTHVFVIDGDNNVEYREIGHGQSGDAVFGHPDGLDFGTRDWPLARLQAIWNGFAGVVPFDDLKPVKKFENRKKALARIWTAIQRLAQPITIHDGQISGKLSEIHAAFAELAAAPQPPAPSPQPPAVASPAPQSDTTPMANTKSKGAKRAAKKPAKAKPAPAEKPAAKTGTKQAEAIRLMERKGGVKLTELMERFGWQAHTVRGFVSAALGKKLGLTVESTKNDAGERIYRIAS
jgi:hypothetical protein